MNDWKELLTTLGISSAWVVLLMLVFGYIGKLLLEKEFSSREKILQQELDKKTEAYKMELDLLRTRNEIRFGKLHEERAAVIKKIYVELRYYMMATWASIVIIKETRFNDMEEQMSILEKRFNEFANSYEENKIYFSVATCDKINDFLDRKNKMDQQIWQLYSDMIVFYNGLTESDRQSALHGTFNEEFLKKDGPGFTRWEDRRMLTSQFLEQYREIEKKLLPQLENEFREILGVN